MGHPPAPARRPGSIHGDQTDRVPGDEDAASHHLHRVPAVAVADAPSCVYAWRMTSESADTNPDPSSPDVDDNGVDLAQIRAMLALAPEERLRTVEEFVEAALEIRELNAARPLR